jgi:hypothetical protein
LSGQAHYEQRDVAQNQGGRNLSAHLGFEAASEVFSGRLGAPPLTSRLVWKDIECRKAWSVVGPERQEVISSKDVECREDALTGETGGQLKGCLSRRRVDRRDGR